MLLLACLPMVVLATLMSLINQVSGTPYIAGGDTPSGTDCSGLASWVANAATDRPIFGDRFNTGNEEAALLARGFQYGSAPNALVIGWNGGHTAVTLPDGASVSSGERGGCALVVQALTRLDSRTTCSCRCHRMVRPRRPSWSMRRPRRPFWSMLRLPQCRLRRPPIYRRRATPVLQIHKQFKMRMR